MNTEERWGRIRGLRDRFGFVRPKGAGRDSDIFFHRGLIGGPQFDRLTEGLPVDYVAEPDPKREGKLMATSVTARFKKA